MRNALPTGTVTFLFTDVEGSTRLLHHLGPERYAEALADHRRALREAFASNQGVEVDTQGDAFFVAFGRASDALAAAQTGQEALAAGPIQVRMGLHTGEPLLTEEGYVGMDIHRAARIAAVAHGGQVLVSQATRDVTRAESLRDLGEHRLKDLSEPERLWQLGGDDFPPLQSLHQTNLPRPEGPLTGRKKELADVLKLLGPGGARVVTLTGPGGVGKTRLALEVGAERVQAVDDGVWFTDLSALREPSLVLPAIAGALGVEGEAAAHIRDRRLLLVLDNFEQVVEAAPDVASLVAACARMQVLVTSREPLHIRGEHAYPLRPLAEAPAVELFRQRAEAADPDFAADYSLVAAICERVDRLPLAVELVAARVGVLGAEALLDRLQDRLPLLTSRSRDSSERQQTLTATIDWSYELLTERERDLFTRLAVFSGGWTLDAAEKVVAADLYHLESLVDKSLVRSIPGRFDFLDTIREYARGKLAANTSEDVLRRRHAEHFLSVAEGLRSTLWERSTSQIEFGNEYANIRSALEWAGSAGEDELLLRLAVASSDFWFMKAHLREGQRWLEAALAGAADADQERAAASAALSALEHMQGDYAAAHEHAEAAVARLRDGGDAATFGLALNRLANAAIGRGDNDRARDLYAEAASCAREAGDTRGLAMASVNLAALEASAGRFDSATGACGTALELFSAIGNTPGRAVCLFYLAQIATAQDRLEEARDLLARSLALNTELDRPGRIASCLEVAATIACRAGDARRAARLVAAAGALREEVGSTPMPTERAFLEGTLTAIREALDDTALEEESRAGAELDLEHAVAYALAPSG